MTRITFISLIICSSFLFSCSKVIDVDLNEDVKGFVIEATLDGKDSTVTVIISNTSSYFDSFSIDFVNNATVTIKDGNGVSTNIPFFAEGKYLLNSYLPTDGMTYTMSVIYEGKEYTSTARLVEEVLQNTPSFELRNPSPFDTIPYYDAFFSIQDQEGELNYYLISAEINNTSYDQLSAIYRISDSDFEGEVHVENFSPNNLIFNDSITYNIRSIEKKIYDYYEQLSKSVGLLSAFNASPSNPNYLWTNQGLGYFSAHYSSKKGIRIQ